MMEALGGLWIASSNEPMDYRSTYGGCMADSVLCLLLHVEISGTGKWWFTMLVQVLSSSCVMQTTGMLALLNAFALRTSRS